MTPLETLEARLRSAAESRQYREVEQLVVEYCKAARSYLISLAPASVAAQEAQRKVHHTLEWTCRMVQAGRESIVLELNRLPRVKRYLQRPPVNGNSWHVEG
ncbi:MAG TPA: hypothetical protein VLY24_18400 [Bryobacteraceae bacterium]|nr:hypothetical protein [Bryobacteraceae bacterium]